MSDETMGLGGAAAGVVAPSDDSAGEARAGPAGEGVLSGVAVPDPDEHDEKRPPDGAVAPLRAVGDVSWAIAQEDAVAFLRRLPSASVDLLVTDPPYESLEKHRAVGTTTRLSHSKSSSNDWFTVFPNQRFEELFTEVLRVLKKDAHFYLFCDQETAFVAKPEGEKVGFKFWKPLIWDKQKIGMGYHYRSRYEMILFFEKGKRKLNDLGIADVIREDRIYRGYPTEKPVRVNRILIEQSSEPGQLVVDPFMGTASAGLAALSTGRRFWGCDVSDKAIAIATERLSATGAPRGELPPSLRPEGQLPLTFRKG
jgi:site-specific DNA-methyltransferase (adenine-specific)